MNSVREKGSGSPLQERLRVILPFFSRMSLPHHWMLKQEEISAKFLRNQVDEHGKTVVVVSHDPRWREFADRTITLCDGQVEHQEKNL